MAAVPRVGVGSKAVIEAGGGRPTGSPRVKSVALLVILLLLATGYRPDFLLTLRLMLLIMVVRLLISQVLTHGSLTRAQLIMLHLTLQLFLPPRTT